LVEFHRDRVAEIEAGASLFNQAMLAEAIDVKNKILHQAIQSLTVGLEKTISSLRVQIESIPDTKSGLLDNWLTNKSSEASEKVDVAKESFQACLLGMRTLTMSYVELNETELATASLKEYMNKLMSAGIDMAYTKSRGVPRKENDMPESVWQEFIDYKKTFTHTINESGFLSSQNLDSIEIELKPSELLETNYEKL